jgi:hypothetical protein
MPRVGLRHRAQFCARRRFSINAQGFRSGWFGGGPPPAYWLTRFVFLRALGFIYAVAFLVLWNQWPGLIGSHGLLPAARYMARVRRSIEFHQLPTLFWSDASDRTLELACAAGLALAILVLLGVENALVMAALWAIYMSFCHVGQTFYGYGWEILLLEAGFLAIFLAPLRSVRPLASRTPPSPIAIVLLRWLVFRVMLGAGLIKLRGDACWTDLTCLAYHYETQPVPGPLSPLFHAAPLWFHKFGVAFNHVVELIAPWFAFGPRRLRYAAGLAIMAFQTVLIASGNLSFLNWLTIAIAIACFDDALIARALPRRLVARAEQLERERRPSLTRTLTLASVACVVAWFSVDPIANMLSREQIMNTSFDYDYLHLVNSYGAFGSVGRVRHEVIVQGTRDADPDTARWLEYEFKCKPGDVMRRPCLITPYHYRLDWQMWFAALSNPPRLPAGGGREPWFVRFVYELLRGEPAVRALLARDPFTDRPPRFVRAELYEYHFAPVSGAGGAWWRRTRVGPYVRPLALTDPAMRKFLADRGWLDEDDEGARR